MNIKTQRQNFHLSQLRLSELAGVSRFRLHLHERGALPLTELEVRRIQGVFTREASRLQKALADFRGIPA
jgi:hypothetical protein